MANRPYVKGIDNLMKGNTDLDGHTFKAVLVDAADYTPDTTSSGHEDLADIPGAARVGTSAAITGLTVTGGAWDFDDVTITGTGGDPAEYLVIYKDSGAEATSWLVCIFDTGTGLPFTPPVGAWTFIYQVDSGTNKCLKIS